MDVDILPCRSRMGYVVISKTVEVGADLAQFVPIVVLLLTTFYWDSTPTVYGSTKIEILYKALQGWRMSSIDGEEHSSQFMLR